MSALEVILKFEDLEVWKRSSRLCADLYEHFQDVIGILLLTTDAILRENGIMNNSDEIFFAEEEEAVEEGEKWKILIADDEPGVHVATKIALEDFSFEGKTLDFLSAYSGKEALRMLEEHSDIVLVLLDVVMETDDAGLRVVKQIREEMKNQHVRVILRTGQAGRFPEKSIIVDYDVNDYKTKTELTSGKLFSSVVTSIRSYTNIRELHEHREHLEELVEKRSEELRQTNETLAFRNEELNQEQEFAQKIFSNIVDPGFLDAVNIKYLLSPMSVFNGDLLLVEQDQSRGQFVMLGDFTGHGLRAALGTIPVSETFRSMVRRGFSIEDIVDEINRKLKEILPVGVFLCACVIHIDTIRNKLSVWNGSLPDLLVPGGHPKYPTCGHLKIPHPKRSKCRFLIFGSIHKIVTGRYTISQ